MNRKILLVEDNADDADLTLRALRRHNICNEVVRDLGLYWMLLNEASPQPMEKR